MSKPDDQHAKGTLVLLKGHLVNINPQTFRAWVQQSEAENGRRWELLIDPAQDDTDMLIERVPCSSEREALALLARLSQHFGAVDLTTPPQSPIAQTSEPQPATGLPVAKHIRWADGYRNNYIHVPDPSGSYKLGDIHTLRQHGLPSIDRSNDPVMLSVCSDREIPLTLEVAKELTAIALGLMDPAPAKEDSK